MLQFQVGPALESGVIPLVLAPIWLLYGYLTPLLDTVFKDEPTTQACQPFTYREVLQSREAYRSTRQLLLALMLEASCACIGR